MQHSVSISNIHQDGGDVFLSVGLKSWKSFEKHIGGPNSTHNQAKKKFADLQRQQ